jgi:hypothetical protein
MIKHILIIISAALAFSTSAFCQDHAAAEALNNLVQRFQRLNHIKRLFRVCKTKYGRRAAG